MARQKQVEKQQVVSECYAIERILDSRSNGSKLEYLIKWKSRPESENSWQSIDDLFSKKKSTPETTRNITQIVVIQAKSPGARQPLTPLENPIARSTAKRAREDGRVSEAEQPKNKRRRGTRINVNTLCENVSDTPKTSKMPLTTPADAEQEEERADNEVDHVRKVRKRQGLHEYLVKWKNSDDDDEDSDDAWIGSETAKAKFPQLVIAYYESILRFKEPLDKNTSD